MSNASSSRLPAYGKAPRPRRFGRLAVISDSMRSVFDLLRRLAASDVTVTLLGETGSGKDVLARALHESGARRDKPFVVFDCASVVPTLAESELFGHERGAFTGAVAAHVGAFERAHGGTLFLDEIGELPLDLQSRLLRAAENRKIRRVGGKRDRTFDARIVAATHRDLAQGVASGVFRQDLYFRLAAAVVRVPPLRERIEDLELLVGDLLRDLGRPDLAVSEGALATLRAHSWPGNVRELKHALAFAASFADGTELEPRHLRLQTIPEGDPNIGDLRLAGQTLEALERIAIQQTLEQSGDDLARTAEILGITVSILEAKMKGHGL